MPRPCSAETGCGSPRPSDHSVGGVGLAALAVDLVGAQHDGLAGPAQQLDDGLVGVGGADRGVDDEDHRVGGLDRELGLRGDGGVDAGTSCSQPPVSTSLKRRPVHSAS